MSDVSAAGPESLALGALDRNRRLVQVAARVAIGARAASNHPLLLLLGLWAAELLVLFVLQQLGTGLGLRVRQMGEDRVWAHLFQFNSLSGVPKSFWLINDRNPISPWWYITFQPLISASPYGIYLVRKIIDLLCASAVYLLLDRLGSGRQRLFALSAAIVTLFWNFSGYGDQIMWNFLGALALSVLTIWLYCKYVDSGRRTAAYLALSLLLYLFAISTYTLQSTSFLAIFVVAFLRGQPASTSAGGWARRLALALLETGYYIALFAIFTLFWYTAARPSSEYYALSLALVRTQFLESIKYLMWHYDYPTLLAEVGERWSLPVKLGVGLVSLVGSFGLLWRAARSDQRAANGSASSSTRGMLSLAGYSLSVAVSLAVATVALEATSGVWVPGLRARMIQQIFQPLLYLGILFGLVALIFRRAPRVARWTATLLGAAVASITLAVSFQYNWDLNQNSAIEERFEAGLKAIVPQPTERTKFIVRMDPGLWHNSDSLSDTYIQSFYRSKLVNMRVLQPGAPISKWEDYSTVVFGPDDKGVQMGDSGATAPEWVPYSQVRVVGFDGERVTLLPTISPSDMIGYRVGFNRDDPVIQVQGASATSVPDGCAYSVPLTKPIPGSGWSVPERTPDGKLAFQWMASTSATVSMPLTCQGAATLQFHAISAMAPDILSSLRVSVDGQPVDVESRVDATGTAISARLGPEVLRRADGDHQVMLSVDRTVVPSGGDRTLAVAFDRIQVTPASRNAGP
jgi:hypothetical protein